MLISRAAGGLLLVVMLVMPATVDCFFKRRQQQLKPSWVSDTVVIYKKPAKRYGPPVKVQTEQQYSSDSYGTVIDHVAYVQQNAIPYYKKPKSKARLLIRSALLLGAGATLLNALAGSTEVITTTTTESPTTTTTASTTTATTTTTTPTTTTTTPTTTTTTPTTTTITTTTTTTTTPAPTPSPVACDQTTAVTATSVGEMGTFATPAKVTGNQKFCQSVTAPANTKISVVCTVVSLTGGSKTFQIFDGSTSAGAILASPQPTVGQTYTTTGNAIYFEAFISASDNYSCKWTVIAAFVRYSPEDSYVLLKAPFNWQLPDYLFDRYLHKRPADRSRFRNKNLG